MEEKLGILEYARCNKIIVADLSFDQDDFFTKTAEKFCETVFFLDHHKIYNDLNSEKTVYIKVPYFSDIDPSKYPASKQLWIQLGHDWIALSETVISQSDQEDYIPRKKLLEPFLVAWVIGNLVIVQGFLDSGSHSPPPPAH